MLALEPLASFMGEVLSVTTATILLERLRSPQDQAVWEEFDSRYRPILIRVGRHLGLEDADAEDAAQETLAQFVRDYRAGRYDRQKGRLRAWIIGICRHRIMDAHRRSARAGGWRGESAFVGLGTEQDIASIWDQEQRIILFDRALRVLRNEGKIAERTLQVFEMVALKNVPTATIAETMQLTTAEVYRVKNRVTKRLREIVAQFSSVYDTD